MESIIGTLFPISYTIHEVKQDIPDVQNFNDVHIQDWRIQAFSYPVPSDLTNLYTMEINREHIYQQMSPLSKLAITYKAKQLLDDPDTTTKENGDTMKTPGSMSSSPARPTN